MASVVYHAYHQIREAGQLKLFQSHRPEYKDGEQLRYFIYVDDVVSICLYLFRHRRDSAIYNVGTGHARSFYDLGRAVFQAMGIAESISYIPIPIDIRDKYQYFTEAPMDKLRIVGYTASFITLEEGIERYVTDWLMKA
jgi:ADP-L-glycero-D-manno-heptose 6-epimerase